MKETLIVAGLGLVIIFMLTFIFCCIKLSSEVKDDNQPSKDRKTKADK